MTWAQREKSGVDAKHFQKALKAKSRSWALGRKTIEGLRSPWSSNGQKLAIAVLGFE
jgi:hypothetical protein